MLTYIDTNMKSQSQL